MLSGTFLDLIIIIFVGYNVKMLPLGFFKTKSKKGLKIYSIYFYVQTKINI